LHRVRGAGILTTEHIARYDWAAFGPGEAWGWDADMRRTRSNGKSQQKLRLIPARQQRLEADGETHRRDCECARCEAGFVPSERQRDLAAKRGAAKQGRNAAVRAAERRKEKARLAQLDLAAYFAQQNAAADAEVQRLRTMRDRSITDRRMDEFLLLRKTGMPLETALAEVDRRFPPGGPAGPDNDNGSDHADLDSAAHRIGLLFP